MLWKFRKTHMTWKYLLYEISLEVKLEWIPLVIRRNLSQKFFWN